MLSVLTDFRHTVGRYEMDQVVTVSFMSELLTLRDNYLDFSGVFRLDQSEIATLVDFVATA